MSFHANALGKADPYEYGKTPVSSEAGYYCNGPLYLWCDSTLHYSGSYWDYNAQEWVHPFTHVVKGLNVFEGKNPYPNSREPRGGGRIQPYDERESKDYIGVPEPVPPRDGGNRAVGYRGGIQQQKSVIKSQGDDVTLASYKKPGQTGLVPTDVILDELPGQRWKNTSSDEYLPHHLTQNPVDPGTIDFGDVRSQLNEEWDAHPETEGELNLNTKAMTDLARLGMTAGIGLISYAGPPVAFAMNLGYWLATSDKYYQEREQIDMPDWDNTEIAFESPVRGRWIDGDPGGAASLMITQFGVRAKPGKQPDIRVEGKVEGSHQYGRPSNRHSKEVEQGALALHDFTLEALPHPTTWLEENEPWLLNDEYTTSRTELIQVNAFDSRRKTDDIMYEAERPQPTIQKPSDSQSTPTYSPDDQIAYETNDEDANGQDLHTFAWMVSQSGEDAVTEVEGTTGWTDVPFNDAGEARVSLIVRGESDLHGFEYVDIDIEEDDGGGIEPGSDVKLTATAKENLFGTVQLAFPNQEYMQDYSGDWLSVEEYEVGDPVRNKPGEVYDHYLFVGNVEENSSATVEFETEGHWEEAHLESTSFVELSAEAN
jgi:hypothetical protein